MAGRVLLIGLGLAHSMNHSLLVLFPPIIPIIVASSNIPLELLGMVSSISFAAFGLGAMVGGILADRVGEGRIIALSLGLGGASAIIIFLLPTALGLAVGFLLIGLWGSFYHPTSTSIISKLYPQGVASAMAIHGGVGHLGQILTPTASVLVALALGWPTVFLIFGGIAVLMSLALYRATPNPPRESQSLAKALISILGIRSLWFVIAFSVTANLGLRAIDFILPTYLVSVRGLSLEMAGLITSLLLAFGVVGQFVGGKPADVIGNRRMMQLAMLGAGAGLLLLVLLGEPSIAALAFVAVFGISFYANQPAETAYIAKAVPSSLRGMAFGALFTIAVSIASISSTLAALLAAQYGATSAVLLAFGFVLVAFIISLLLPPD